MSHIPLLCLLFSLVLKYNLCSISFTSSTRPWNNFRAYKITSGNSKQKMILGLIFAKTITRTWPLAELLMTNIQKKKGKMLQQWFSSFSYTITTTPLPKTFVSKLNGYMASFPIITETLSLSANLASLKILALYIT